jgi:hypothetical protein
MQPSGNTQATAQVSSELPGEMHTPGLNPLTITSFMLYAAEMCAFTD